MMNRKSPQRTCIGCGIVRDKKELIRIVHTPEDEYHLDPGGKRNGRGAYMCPSEACLEKALKLKSLSRAFGVSVPEAAAEGLRKEMEALDTGK